MRSSVRFSNPTQRAARTGVLKPVPPPKQGELRILRRLHAEGEPVKSRGIQDRQRQNHVFAAVGRAEAEIAGVRLECDFCVRSQCKRVAHGGEHMYKPPNAEHCGRTAAEIDGIRRPALSAAGRADVRGKRVRVGVHKIRCAGRGVKVTVRAFFHTKRHVNIDTKVIHQISAPP